MSAEPFIPSNALEGRVIVVIGAGAVGDGWSNGKACAVGYARAGGAVVCADFVRERAEETASLITQEGGRALAVQVDATSEAGMMEVMGTARDAFGSLDVVHNNVGVNGAWGTPDEITPAAWDQEVALNLTTTYLGIRCAAPIMIPQGGGAIVNVSSLAAVRFLRRPNVAYTASKAAVEALTRSCATAYGPINIRVNCIRIGFSETPLMRGLIEGRGLSAEQMEEQMARSRRKVPLRAEHTGPFDVAAAAVFLASDQARHVTGVILNVDGGLECAPV